MVRWILSNKFDWLNVLGWDFPFHPWFCTYFCWLLLIVSFRVCPYVCIRNSIFISNVWQWEIAMLMFLDTIARCQLFKNSFNLLRQETKAGYWMVVLGITSKKYGPLYHRGNHHNLELIMGTTAIRDWLLFSYRRQHNIGHSFTRKVGHGSNRQDLVTELHNLLCIMSTSLKAVNCGGVKKGRAN